MFFFIQKEITTPAGQYFIYFIPYKYTNEYKLSFLERV